MFRFSRALAIVAILFLTSSAVRPDTQGKPAVTGPKSVQAETLNEHWSIKWWIPRHKEKLLRIAQGNVDLLMIGDSITHHWETEGRGAKVWAEYYAKRNVVNLGYAGDRTENVIWRLQNGEVKGIAPKLAVLLIGTNNAGHRKEKSEETALGIKTIISELRTRLPETKILLLAIFPRGRAATNPMRNLHTKTNELIANFADDPMVFFLDLGGKFLDDKGNILAKYMPDSLHPNEDGYRVWAEAMEPTIKKLMDEKL